MNEITNAFIDAAKFYSSLAEAIRTAAEEVTEDGVVDSYLIAESICAEVTYVQHLLRETPHICRHTIGDGLYRAHTAAVCGGGCMEKWDSRVGKVERVNACPGCGIHVPPAATECDFCGLDVAA
jgi:hypothetical protein